jgi:hypothetical protein
MRLIDADKVLETMRSNTDMQELCLPIHFIDFVVENMPTVDAEPVRHGRWIRGENKSKFPAKPTTIWYCSCCGEMIRYNDSMGTYQKKKKKVNEVNPRCRRCGAKMDGGEE